MQLITNAWRVTSLKFIGNVTHDFSTASTHFASDWALQWRHNERDVVSNHRRLDCLLNRLFRRRSKKTQKLLVTGLCTGNLQMTGGFPSQRASSAENVSIWWRHHGEICEFELYISGKLRPVDISQTVFSDWISLNKITLHFDSNSTEFCC